MNKHLHDLHILEQSIIELEYLVKAMQALSGDDGMRICLLNLTQIRISVLKILFYRHWRRSAQSGEA